MTHRLSSDYCQPLFPRSWSLVFILLVLTLSAGLLWYPVPLYSADRTDSIIPAGQSALTFSAGFIRPGVPMHGVVVQPGTTRSVYGAGDLLFVRFGAEEEAMPGDLYTLYKKRHRVLHPASGQYLGDLISILGIARVTKVDMDLATVQVIRSFTSISAGDGAMRFVPQQAEPKLPGKPLVDRPGMIVDIQAPRTLVAQRNIVFIDWGRRDGLQVGDRLEVISVRTGVPIRKIGELQVLALEDATATTLVIRSTDTLNRGDRVTFMEPTPVRTEAEKPQPIEQAKATPLPVPQPSLQVSIKQVGDQLKLTLDGLVNQLQYESGQFTVKPEGLAILNQVSELLKTVQDRHFRIEGHTDDVEIGPKLKPLFPTNKELSQARATHVLRYLTEVGGLDRASVSAIGHADTKPVAANDTEENRAKNRRIDIVILPKEAGAPMPESPSEATPSTPAPPGPPSSPGSVQTVPSPEPMAPVSPPAAPPAPAPPTEAPVPPTDSSPPPDQPASLSTPTP